MHFLDFWIFSYVHSQYENCRCRLFCGFIGKPVTLFCSVSPYKISFQLFNINLVSGVKFTWISGSKGQNCVFEKNLKYFWQLNFGIKIASKCLHVTQKASIQTWVLISNIAVIFKQKCSSLGLFFSSCKQFHSRLLSKFNWEVWPFIKPNWKTVRLYIFRTITIWIKLG